MDVGSISQNALLGINRGLNQASQAASSIASPEALSGEGDNNSSTQALLELQQAEAQVQLSAKVAQTEGDIIGSLLDVRA